MAVDVLELGLAEALHCVCVPVFPLASLGAVCCLCIPIRLVQPKRTHSKYPVGTGTGLHGA